MSHEPTNEPPSVEDKVANCYAMVKALAERVDRLEKRLLPQEPDEDIGLP